MAILKQKNVDSWDDIYINEILECLKRSENLADLLDPEIARQNLGVADDNVITHLHDHLYVPFIYKKYFEIRPDILNHITKLQQNLTELQNLYNNVQTNFDIRLQDLVNIQEKYNAFLYYGPTPPLNIQENIIWHDTSKNLVKTFKDGMWTIFELSYT